MKIAMLDAYYYNVRGLQLWRSLNFALYVKVFDCGALR